MGLAVLGAILVATAAWQLGYLTTPGETVPFIVQKGENFAMLAGRLEKAGIIQSGRALRWYVNISGPHKGLKRGEFGLNKNMPIPEVVSALIKGKPMQYPLTVPEGYNIYQIADLVQAMGMQTREDFLAAAKSPDVTGLIPTIPPGGKTPRSIEGYIFPDTYFIQRVFTAKEIAQQMVQRFREVYKTVAPQMLSSPTVTQLGLSAHQVITLASIVEKETGAAEERPIIAGVFINRLHKRMRLQTDPTVIYGVWSASGKWDGNIRTKDLHTPTDYNTYQMEGLPIGPIASPGLNAIQAVLNPAQTDYLFFVSKNNGTHIFSRDYAAHNKAVQETQLKAGARDGKSWRDLPSAQRAK